MRALACLTLLLLAPACADAPDVEPATEPVADAPPDAPVPSSGDAEALDAAVRAQAEADGMLTGELPYRSAFIDLNGDGTEEALALMEGVYCGTGGCTLYVFEGGPDGYTLDSDVSLVRGPIVVADAATAGWRDLVFVVSGGGAAPKTVALQHGADGYPENASMVDATTGGPAAGDVVLSYFEPGSLGGFADVAGEYPADVGLWSRPFLKDRLVQLLWGDTYDAFTERMQTVSPVQEDNGIYYITGNMDNADGSDAAILVADPEQNVLKAWVWRDGELTERAEAPLALDLPSDVETMIQNMNEYP